MDLNYIISDPDFSKQELITLEVAKQHLKIDFDYEDKLINQYIFSAISAAEGYLGVFLFQRLVIVESSSFLKDVELEYLPVLNNEFTVEYSTSLGQTVSLDSGYIYKETYSKKPKFVFDNSTQFPESDLVKYSYTAGMTPDSLPDAIYQAILLILSDLYEYRTDRKEIIDTRAQSLMRSYKKFV